MSTTASITFLEGKEELVTVLHQFNGQIDGVGYNLANWLIHHTMINGISEYNTRFCNGSGCLAAAYIRDFKESVGGLYILPHNMKCDCDYIYTVEIPDIILSLGDERRLNDISTISVRECNCCCDMFKGKPEELLCFKQ